jgi:hypothetical protein
MTTAPVRRHICWSRQIGHEAGNEVRLKEKYRGAALPGGRAGLA